MRTIPRVFCSSLGLLNMSLLIFALCTLPGKSFAAQPDPAQRVFSSPEEARQALTRRG